LGLVGLVGIMVSLAGLAGLANQAGLAGLLGIMVGLLGLGAVNGLGLEAVNTRSRSGVFRSPSPSIVVGIRSLA
jgi:hypothetical protein